MKKTCLLFLCIIGLGMASIKVQAQADLIGAGYGLGFATTVVPMILDLGLEGSVYGVNGLKSSGSYRDDNTGALIPYDGSLGLHMTRFGGLVKLTAPGLDLLPVVGPLFHPIFHFGTQNGTASVDGSVRIIDNGSPIAAGSKIQGSYALVGFPLYLGPLFVEPMFGAQHLYVPGYANYKNTIDAQIAAGINF